MNDNFQNYRQNLSSMKMQVAKLMGRKEELEEEQEVLRNQIAFSKGRLALKGQVDEFLEALQEEVNQQRVGQYAQLLTAAMRDVLPGESEKEIILELETRAGVPSLNISKMRGNDRKSDIFESEGGGLTNVICLALRTIATMRSGKRKFLVLDEPDCWLSPDAVPNFFNVLRLICNDLKMQMLVITHHDLSLIGTDANILEAEDSWKTGVKINRLPGGKSFLDDEDGVREIHVKNHSSFVDAKFHLSPGLNVFRGGNNVGKSRLTRALRSIAYGDSDDDDIRDFKAPAEVDIVLEGGKTLSWSRQIKRNPVTKWKLTDKQGLVMKINDVECETGGKTVPDWVGENIALGVKEIEDLEVQFGHQKEPVFLLTQPGSRRASVLSIGDEADYLRKMIALQKTNSSEDQKTVKSGEQKLIQIMEKLALLEGLSWIEKQLMSCEENVTSLSNDYQKINSLKNSHENISKAKNSFNLFQNYLTEIGKLPTDIPKAKEMFNQAFLMQKMYRGIHDNNANTSLNSDLVMELKNLKDPDIQIPEFHVMSEFSNKMKHLQVLMSQKQKELDIDIDFIIEPVNTVEDFQKAKLAKELSNSIRDNNANTSLNSDLVMELKNLKDPDIHVPEFHIMSEMAKKMALMKLMMSQKQKELDIDIGLVIEPVNTVEDFQKAKLAKELSNSIRDMNQNIIIHQDLVGLQFTQEAPNLLLSQIGTSCVFIDKMNFVNEKSEEITKLLAKNHCEMEDVLLEMQTITEESGGMCPLCGMSSSFDGLIHQHGDH